MNSPNGRAHDSAIADETLRLIARLPAPDGLEDRVHAALRTARRSPRVLAWPRALGTGNSFMRAAAAAAIVFVIAGGGWGIYTRVQPSRVIAMPQHVALPGGFSNAGAMRTPQTLNGPVVKPATVPAKIPAKTAPSTAGHGGPEAQDRQPAAGLTRTR
jgi:hypothetical protein